MIGKLKLYLFTAALVIVGILCAYLMVFQAYGHYGSFLAFLCLFLIFISILLLQFLWIDTAPDSFWTYNKRALLVLIIMLPLAYSLVKAENSFENKNLQLHAENATETITYTYVNRSKHGVTYHAVYQYEYGGQTYTHTLGSYHDIYKIGDTLQIIYSTEHPDIDRVIAYKYR